MDRMTVLSTLLEREQERRDEAQQVLLQARQKLEQAQQQREALETYRQEYHDRWSRQFRHSGTVEILRCYQGFVERLDHAIAAQAQELKLAGQRVEASAAQLRQREIRVSMVRKLIERRENAARLLAQRQEQKASDEAAMRMGWAARQALQSA